MKKLFFIGIFFFTLVLQAQTIRTIHVFTALCDNEHQNIVRVSDELGNGKDEDNNLYLGAMYGFRTHFKKSENWVLLKQIANPETNIIERLIFKHHNGNVYLLADAYDGEKIKSCIKDFFLAADKSQNLAVRLEDKDIEFAGKADLIAYLGHNGLMDFDIELDLDTFEKKDKDAVILACISKSYFASYLRNTAAKPLIWTTGLMCPEAYTLEGILEGWIKNEMPEQIRERAASEYSRYQGCSISAASNLFTTGW